MYQEKQLRYPDNSGEVVLKRKRGRPRKYPKPDQVLRESAFGFTGQKLYNADNAGAPPGFGKPNGKQTDQMNASKNVSDVKVGQEVYGVVEAAFGAGYLLAIKVGNSETTLRGVVFKPGNFVPVSGENDLVPDIEMIRRKEVAFPRRKTEQYLNARPNQIPDGATEPQRSKPVPGAANQTGSLVSLRGNAVPSADQQLNNIQTVSTSVNQAAAGKLVDQASETCHTLNGTVPSSKRPPLISENQMLWTHPQSRQRVVWGGPSNQTTAQVWQESEPNVTRKHGRPFEKLLSEVIKSIQPPAESAQAETCRVTAKGCGHRVEDDEEPLTVEPLRSIEPNKSAFMFKPVEDYRTGNMTHLLQAVQENMRENEESFWLSK